MDVVADLCPYYPCSFVEQYELNEPKSCPNCKSIEQAAKKKEIDAKYYQKTKALTDENKQELQKRQAEAEERTKQKLVRLKEEQELQKKEEEEYRVTEALAEATARRAMKIAEKKAYDAERWRKQQEQRKNWPGGEEQWQEHLADRKKQIYSRDRKEDPKNQENEDQKMRQEFLQEQKMRQEVLQEMKEELMARETPKERQARERREARAAYKKKWDADKRARTRLQEKEDKERSLKRRSEERRSEGEQGYQHADVRKTGDNWMQEIGTAEREAQQGY